MMNLRIGLLAALTLVAAACEPAPVRTPAPQPSVTTALTETRAIALRLPFAGRAENAREVTLRALVDGQITRVGAADGARVGKGCEVFTLGGPRVASRMESLSAAVDAATRGAAAAQTALERAERRQAAHLAAAGEAARAEREAAAGEAELAAAKAAHARYRAALTVTAPVSGRFTDRRVSPGQEVLSGEPLGDILTREAIRIAADVVPRPGLEPLPGQQAMVETAEGAALPAVVQAVQARTGAGGMTRVWLVGDRLAQLNPGTVVRGFIVAARHGEAVTIPPAALVCDRDGNSLVYVGEASPYQSRRVTLGERGPDWVEVTRGLEAGETVVTDGAYELYWAEFSREFKLED